MDATTSASDRPLLRRSLDDPAAFQEFYRAHADRVVIFFARRAYDPELALDLTGETFAVALERRAQFRGSTWQEEQGWLFAIARSQLQHYWRRGEVERAALERIGHDPPHATLADIEWVERMADLPRLRSTVRSALECLPDDQAYAVVEPGRRGATVRRPGRRAQRLRAGRAGARVARPARDGGDARRPRARAPAMTGLPPGLEDFGERLRAAAEVANAQDAVSGGAAGPARSRLSVGAAMATAAVGAGAVKLADRGGEDIELDPGTKRSERAPKDPSVAAASATADPEGGPPWVVRVFFERGNACVMAGRLQDGDFGQVQRGEFRRFPASAPGTCAAPGAKGPVMAAQRNGTTSTVVFGVGVDNALVKITFDGATQSVKPVSLGAFLAVFPGGDRDAPIVVRARAGGRAVTQTL